MSEIQIGDVTYTDEQLQEILSKHGELEKSYKKLESEFTKTSQAKKELEAQSEQAKEWLAFNGYLQENPTLAKDLSELVDRYQKGGSVTQGNLNTIAKAIDKADAKGDSELVKRLEAMEAAMQEKQVEDTYKTIAEQAKKDSLEEFTMDGFKEFAGKYFADELELGDKTPTAKQIKLAYTAYEAHVLKETTKRGKVPKLASDSIGAPPAGKGKDDAPKGLKARAQQAMEALRRT